MSAIDPHKLSSIQKNGWKVLYYSHLNVQEDSNHQNSSNCLVRLNLGWLLHLNTPCDWILSYIMSSRWHVLGVLSIYQVHIKGD